MSLEYRLRLLLADLERENTAFTRYMARFIRRRLELDRDTEKGDGNV